MEQTTYNGLVSFCTAFLTVSVTVNRAPPRTADLPCKLQPNFLSTIVNTECSKYSKMQACPQLKCRQKPIVIKHELYITVKISLKPKD